MKILETTLEGVTLLEPKRFGDHRGFFLECYRETTFQDAGLPIRFVQDNHSHSAKGVLRGLHYQLTQPQGKLVRVSRGAVYDVAVDIRVGSPNFGRWFGTELNDENLRVMYIPPGFAHGFLTLQDDTDFHYKCTDYYHPQSEQGILWNDSDIGIEWPNIDNLQLSDKDQQNPPLKQQAQNKLPVYTQRS